MELNINYVDWKEKNLLKKMFLRRLLLKSLIRSWNYVVVFGMANYVMFDIS